MNAEFRLINLAYLERVTEGDRALQRELLNTLMKQMPAEIPVLRAHHAAGRWKEVADISHRLRGSLAFAGNDRMVAIATEIERLGEGEGDRARLPDLLAELEAAAPEVLAELRTAAAALP